MFGLCYEKGKTIFQVLNLKTNFYDLRKTYIIT